MITKPIFFDPTGQRARWVSWTTWTFAVANTLLVLSFALSLFIVPDLPGVTFGLVHRAILGTPIPARAARPDLAQAAKQLGQNARAHIAEVPRATRRKAIAVTPAARGGPLTLPGTERQKPMTIGFYVNWDDTSYPALKRALPALDWLVPAWLTLHAKETDIGYEPDRAALDLIHRTKPSLPILPLLQNASEDVWDGPGLARMLALPASRAHLIERLTDVLDKNRFHGVVLDFEQVPPAAQADLQTFVAELGAAFKPHRWLVAIAVPFDDTAWNYQAYGKSADFVVLMAYDQHWSEGEAGAIAGQSWFEDTLAKRMEGLDPSRTIVALGGYGYDWVKGEEASDLTFQEAMLAARDSEADIEFDDASLNPHFSYVEDDGKAHDVWFLDGVTAYNQINEADRYRVAGYALWRLGSEDPSIWNVLGKPYGAPAPAEMHGIAMGHDIDFEGTGEILHVLAEPSPGSRTFEVDPKDGLLTDETYTKLPTSFVMQRVGAVPHKVALTFDDGPDPKWTPQILDVLKEKHVAATFFIIGSNADAYPDLIERTLAEGHEIGNHTFTHPNLGETPARLNEIELNATQRLFEAITGRSMRLFRPPFFGDAEPTTQDEVVPIRIAQSMGYVTVGLRADSDDWQMPAPEEIVKRVMERVTDPNPESRGQIVLLHDSGGDRSQTVKALPILIETLRAKGYEIVPVSALAGLTRDQAMPKLPAGSLAMYVDRPIFLTLGWFGHALHWTVLTTIALGFARLLFLCGLGLKSYFDDRRRQAPAEPQVQPLVSVLIPAFNEEKVIAESVARILESRHANLEVIVIDDGSKDRTSDVVRARFGGDARVTLITIENSGKAAAVNTGLARARGDVVIALDADTQFEPDAISKLIRWFADPKVGAVAGNAKVGNRINVITRWQALEYITAQNLERRAIAALDCITVVPGAVGAWRRAALVELGGFPGNTLAEDQDLTIALQRAGYRALFDAEAVAWTEAPDTVSGLARQRFRWAYGTLQCLWKHRSACLNPRYGALGLVALPQAWLFQIVFAMLSPVLDLMLVWQVVGTELDYLQHREQFNPNNLMLTLGYYALFMAVDLGAALVAFLMERKEQWSLLWWLVAQRFGYRQIMYYVVLKSLATALTGPFVGWGKLERTATVTKSKIS